MAFARDPYTASASQTDFTISFPYLSEDDVLVYRNGTLAGNDADADQTSYQIVASTTVRFGAGLDLNDVVVIQRATSQTTRLVDYASASTLTEEDLDNDSIQAFYMAQEAIDIANTALGLGSNDNWDATSLPIENVTDPTNDQDAATKAYGDANWGGTAATNAAASAAAAATSASNAATSETNAAASYDSFDDRYLGSKSSEPTLDNDGDALAEGALYWNSTGKQMWVYDGSAWEVVGDTSFTYFTFVASASQTSFTGADANGNTLAFTNANRLVFLNGLLLREGAGHDFTATSGTTITLNTGANVNDVLEVFTATAFSAASGITQATGDSRYILQTDLLDEDDMSTDSALAPASQQSIKAYADSLHWGAWSSANDLTNGGADDISELELLSGLSGVNEIEIIWDAVSLATAGDTIGVQLGTGAGPTYTTSGYLASGTYVNAAGSGAGTLETTFMGLTGLSSTATNTYSGRAVLTHLGSNLWIGQGNGAMINAGSGALTSGGGTVTLSGQLTAIKFISGSNNFDGGNVYIRYR